MMLEQILEAAADLIEVSWAQGSEAVDFHGPYCLGIALSKATRWLDPTLESINHLSDAITQEIGTKDLVAWNDTPGRTQAEVATAIRNAKRWL
jgi:hypothetical protein